MMYRILQGALDYVNCLKFRPVNFPGYPKALVEKPIRVHSSFNRFIPGLEEYLDAAFCALGVVNQALVGWD